MTSDLKHKDSSSDELDEVVSSSDENISSKHDGEPSRFRPVSFLMMNSPATSFFPSLGSQKQKTARSSFTSAVELLDYVTRNWRSNFVTIDLHTEDLLLPFLTRPFSLVVYVDAPLLVRFQRCLQ